METANNALDAVIPVNGITMATFRPIRSLHDVTSTPAMLAGMNIVRSRKSVHLKQTNNHITITVIETINAKNLKIQYVLNCDAAHDDVTDNIKAKSIFFSRIDH